MVAQGGGAHARSSRAQSWLRRGWSQRAVGGKFGLRAEPDKRKIPRPASENAGLRDDAETVESSCTTTAASFAVANFFDYQEERASLESPPAAGT